MNWDWNHLQRRKALRRRSRAKLIRSGRRRTCRLRLRNDKPSRPARNVRTSARRKRENRGIGRRGATIAEKRNENDALGAKPRESPESRQSPAVREKSRASMMVAGAIRDRGESPGHVETINGS